MKYKRFRVDDYRHFDIKQWKPVVQMDPRKQAEYLRSILKSILRQYVQVWLSGASVPPLRHIEERDLDLLSCSNGFFLSSAAKSCYEHIPSSMFIRNNLLSWGHLLSKPPLEAFRRKSALCFLKPVQRSLSVKTALLLALTLAKRILRRSAECLQERIWVDPH